MHITRRSFLKTTALSAAAWTLPKTMLATSEDPLKKTIKLGQSGIETSILSFGTGTHGSDKASKQTRLGLEAFVDLAGHAFETGVRFFDAADSYGSHPYLSELFRHIPREKVTLLSKLWNRPSDWANFTTAQDAVDRFRKELNQDYIDIVLMHCMVEPDWTTRYRAVMDDLSELREKGVIGSYGASFHSIYALKAAVESDWPEVLFVRFNDTGTLMDHYPHIVAPLLQHARKIGKGIVGMKIFGGGKTVQEEQRESSLKFVLSSNALDMMTIGFASQAEFDDTVQRLRRISSALTG
ncbi:aldo/keto reductase [candidate division KSB1 bacterium]|nr:aldo/keto reductase [candidate division KSB1 bacterium]RQW00168.1 MAG: aldo/keto reductase [candidate division KSB1 bacterium]